MPVLGVRVRARVRAIKAIRAIRGAGSDTRGVDHRSMLRGRVRAVGRDTSGVGDTNLN